MLHIPLGIHVFEARALKMAYVGYMIISSNLVIQCTVQYMLYMLYVLLHLMLTMVLWPSGRNTLINEVPGPGADTAMEREAWRGEWCWLGEAGEGTWERLVVRGAWKGCVGSDGEVDRVTITSWAPAWREGERQGGRDRS